MVVENKKNKSRHTIDANGWQTLKDLGFAKNYNVISRDDQPENFIPAEIVQLKKFTTKKQTKNE